MAITFNTTITSAKTVWFKPNTGSTVDRGGVNAVALFPATTAVVGDSVVFASEKNASPTNAMKWNVLTINLATALAATSVTGVWEYCSRTTISSGVAQWNALTVITDNTNGLKNTGTNALTFTVPNDWYNFGDQIASPSGYAYYQFLIRYRITAISGQTSGGITAASASAIQTTRWSIDVSGYTSGAPCTFAAIAAASVAGGWGVVTNVDNSYVFNCSLVCVAGNYLDTTNEMVLFRNGYHFANAGVLTAGRLISGSNTRYGSTFIWESDNCDYYNNSLGNNLTVLYASQFKHIYYGTGSANGTWGGGTCCTSLGITYEGFRNIGLGSDKTKVIIDMKSMGAYYSGADGHIETPGAIVKNVTVAGGSYCVRHLPAYNNLYVHQCDFSGPTSSPINPYQVDTLTNALQDHVDCTWGSFADTNKVRWNISAAPVGTNTDHKMWETYSLQANVVDSSGVAISGAQARISGAVSGELLNTATNPDGYICTEYGTVTSGTVSLLNDTGKAWTTDQHFYKEVLLTSGTGAGQRRIIKKGNTATQLPFAWDCLTAPAAGTKYIIIPYLRAKAMSPAALTVSTLQWSVVSVNNNPFVLKLRRYGYIYTTTSLSISAPVVSSYTLAANPFTVKSEAAASAITGITVNGATSTITITATTTLHDLYDYTQWWAAQSANIQYAEPITTTDGSTYTSAYNIVLNGGDLTGGGSVTMATGTTFTKTSGAYDGIIINADGTRQVHLLLTGIVAGSRVQLYDTTASTELYNGVPGITNDLVYTYSGADHTVRIRVAQPGYLFVEATATAGSTGFNYTVAQTADDVYTTNAIDGSTVTEFSVTGSTIEAFINDPDNTTSIQRLYNWWCYMLSTATGIADQGNYVRATDTTNYRMYTGLKLYNSKTNPLVLTGGYFVPAAGGTPIDCYDTAGGPIFMGYPHVVGFAYSSGSGLSTAEHNQLMALPTPSTIWAHGIEAGYSAEELLRIALSALAGKVSGAAGTTIAFRDLADSKDRITATVDSNGNRSGVTLNVS